MSFPAGSKPREKRRKKLLVEFQVTSIAMFSLYFKHAAMGSIGISVLHIYSYLSFLPSPNIYVSPLCCNFEGCKHRRVSQLEWWHVQDFPSWWISCSILFVHHQTLTGTRFASHILIWLKGRIQKIIYRCISASISSPGLTKCCRRYKFFFINS